MNNSIGFPQKLSLAEKGLSLDKTTKGASFGLMQRVLDTILATLTLRNRTNNEIKK